MITYKNEPNSNIVELFTDDELPEEKSDRIVAQIEADIEQHGTLRILHEIRSPHGTDPSTFWKDAKFVLDRNSGFSHIALVTDADWLARMSESAGRTLSAEARVFKRFSEGEASPTQIAEAQVWLKNA